MITDSYDVKTEPIIKPEDYYGPQKHICDICILTFSRIIFEEALETFNAQKAAEIGSCGGNIPIYTFEIPKEKNINRGESENVEKLRIGILLCNIGSVAAGINITESNWLIGATKYIMFGSAGALDQSKTKGKYVVPTKAYRDEGMSYHYAPPSDYIEVTGSKKVGEIFDEIGAPYVKGYCWTTDTWYRETRGQMDARRNEGCIAVDMEVSGAQAVCDFYGWELYCFLMTGDVLDEPVYDVAELSAANHDLDKLYLAFEIARRI